MEKSWYARLTLLLAFCALAVYLLFPTYVFHFKATEEEKVSAQAFCRSLPRWAHCSKLNLGLDLQGGVHLVMGVRTDKAVEHRLDRYGDAVSDALREKNLGAAQIVRSDDGEGLDVTYAEVGNAEQVAQVERMLRRDFSVLDTARRSFGWHLALNAEELQAIRDGAVEQTVKSIRNRADKLGVTEPTIARRGHDSVLIQLPGVKDPQHAIDIIGRTAQLEFTLVDAQATKALRALGDKALPSGIEVKAGLGLDVLESAQDAAKAYFADKVPAGKLLAFGAQTNVRGEEVPGHLRPYVIEARASLTGDYLTNAQVAQNPQNAADYYVTMTFDAQGAKLFEKLTEQNVGRELAIVLDGKISSTPVIKDKIGGGSAQITLGQRGDAHAKFQEAKDLVLVLKAGALPAPVEVREKRQVGKTLGQDTVAQGTSAMAVGTALVVLFMALYYKKSGMMANAALLLNVLFMMACLALADATLTLPGMAGIVLTVGMAVDANVLIFERIREELRLGKPARAAIDAGYKKAFGTILDSNLTTLIAGFVLWQYGSGPVRGFAVTLIIGLCCSLYTAIVVTRLLFDYSARNRQLQALSI